MATTSEQYINEMYDKQKASTLQGLESAYNKNVSTLDAQAAKIPQDYYEQKREVEGNANVQQKNMNEIFNANGLNTGAIGQAALAMSNQKAKNLATLNKGQADAESALALQRTQLENDYKTQVQQAIQESDYNRAQALYKEYQNQQADAKSQVDAMLKMGVLPSSELIAKSGYTAEYVNSIRNAYLQQQAARSSGGGGYRSSSSDDDDDGFDDGGDLTSKKAGASGFYDQYVANSAAINNSKSMTTGQRKAYADAALNAGLITENAAKAITTDTSKKKRTSTLTYQTNRKK